jgi:hypothetical protein
MGEIRCPDADLLAGCLKIRRQIFVSPDVIDDDVTPQVDEIIRLQRDGRVNVELVGPVRVQLPPQKTLEIIDVAHEMGSLPADVMKGTHLEIPWIPDKGEFEETVEKFPWQHFIGRYGPGMAGELTGDAMAGEPADAAADRHGDPVRVPPLIPVEGGTDTGAAGFGDMNEKKIMVR